MVSHSWPRAPGASGDAAVPAAVAVDVAAAAAAILATVGAAVATMGVAAAAAARGCLLRVPLLLMLLVTTIVVALARTPALPASSAGSTLSPGSVATCMGNGQRKD